MDFTCTWDHEGTQEVWDGRIISLESHGGHYEIHIESVNVKL